jgi:hypothetical protein
MTVFQQKFSKYMKRLIYLKMLTSSADVSVLLLAPIKIPNYAIMIRQC